MLLGAEEDRRQMAPHAQDGGCDAVQSTMPRSVNDLVVDRRLQQYPIHPVGSGDVRDPARIDAPDP